MTDSMTYEIANVEMAAVWDGEEGDDWTENADRYDATDRFITARFDALVDIAPDARVLDVGCGTGKSTRTAARRAVDGRAWGIDLSSRMLDLARRQATAEGITNTTFLRGDAQVHPFEPGSHDLAISSFGAMFFDDPAAAFANVGRSLRSDGRLAFIAWRRFEENEWLTEIFGAVTAGRDLPVPPAGEPGPFGLADRAQTAGWLEQAGFTAVDLAPVDEPFCAGSDPDDAWGFISEMGIVKGLSGQLAPADRDRCFDDLRARIDGHATTDGVLFGSAAWFITARWPGSAGGR